MYRSRRGRFGLPQLIVLGVISGIVFVIYSYLQQPGPTTPVELSALSTNTSVPEQPIPVQQIASTSQPQFQPDIPPGTRLFIPKAGIYQDIVRVYLDGTNWDVSHLGQNVGHLQGTAWLDNPGNIVLSGHIELADGRRGIFANLHELAVDDLIVIEDSAGQRRNYLVVEVKTTTPDDLTPLYPSTTEKLTLITCGNYDFFQDEYLDRIVVVAERVG